MWRATHILIVTLTLLATAVWELSAQQIRCQDVGIEQIEIALEDSMLIDPKSVIVIPNQRFDYASHTQIVTLQDPVEEPVTVCYKIFPLNLNRTYRNKSTDLYDSTADFRPIYSQSQVLQSEQLFSPANIYTSGSLTRGVSFGNRQNVNVISSFNFQMDGQLTESIKIRADITDQNVPFQPEGNTQQIREFDNVTVEIYNDDLSLKAGDVVLQNRSSYFLKYFKNVLGGSFDIAYHLGDSNAHGLSSLAVAAAKGQFIDITLSAREGQQGPYQLSGPSGQNFAIVLANSEKVYLDGRLLKRGYNYDYTIDYNLGELTFNPNVLITQFSRIRVTYEYSDQNYSRSIIAANQKIDLGSFELNFGFYREKDDVNRPLAFLLTEEDKVQMSMAGDDDIPVPISSDVSTDFSTDRVLYVRRDTIDRDVNFQSVFVFSRDSTVELYQVSFTNVGFGNGDYSLAQNDVNGRVYEWVSPINGESQGEYAPVRFVPAPNQRQMAIIGGVYHINDYIDFHSETAFSNQDLNLYSNLDSDDDKDLATKSGLSLNAYPLGRTEEYRLSAYMNYEYDGNDFKPIDRFRVIEFDRNWSYNASTDTFRTADNIFHSGIRLEKNSKNRLGARYSLRNKANAIDGHQQHYEFEKDLGPAHLSGSFFDMNNENLRELSTWKRWHAETYFNRYFIIPGYRIQEDLNEVFSSSYDSLVRTAMNFQAQQFYLRSQDSLKTSFRLEHIYRKDRSVLGGRLVPYSKSKTSSINIATPTGKGHYLNLTATYRELSYEDDFPDLENEKLILGRILARNAFFDRHIMTDINYATSSSREILREFVFVQVAPGEGTHTWRDLNGDGIQDLTEFFDAINFDERNYIKVFVPTNEFVEAFNTIFIFTLIGQMPRTWQSGHGLKKIASKLSMRTNININKKNTNDGFDQRFNPFSLDIANEQLIFTRDAFRSTVFLNRSGRGFGADFTYSVSRGKQQISRGIDSRFQRDQLLNLRYHLNGEWTVTANIGRGLKRNASQFQEDRNFEIQSRQIGPGLSWQPNQNFRLSCVYNTNLQKNLDAEIEERSEINELTFENRWSNGIKNSLSSRFSFTQISFDGDENTASAYELLNALRPGNNYSWQLNYSQKLISGLQVSLTYQGRKSVDSPVIHLGRVQITALF